MIAEDYKIYITVRTDGDKNIVKYGVENDHPIELALFEDHNFLYIETEYTKYSIMNYDNLKDKKEWWKFVSPTKRQSDRGMNSLDLMRTIV